MISSSVYQPAHTQTQCNTEANEKLITVSHEQLNEVVSSERYNN